MSSCALSPTSTAEEDVKPAICSHGYPIETCPFPECGPLEITRILNSLQSEGIPTSAPEFDFGGAQLPSSPFDLEDYAFEVTGPVEQVPFGATGLESLPPPPPPCAGAGLLVQDSGHRASPPALSPHDAVLHCRLQRTRHPSRSSVSEGGYSSDHTSVPSPAPSTRQVCVLHLVLPRIVRKGAL